MKTILLRQPHRVMDACTNSIWSTHEKTVSVPDETTTITGNGQAAVIGYNISLERYTAEFPEYATGYSAYGRRAFYTRAEEESAEQTYREVEARRQASKKRWQQRWRRVSLMLQCPITRIRSTVRE